MSILNWLIILVFLLHASTASAGNFTVGYRKTMGFLFGPDRESADLQDSGIGNATAEIEFLYLFGEQQGIAIGLVNGTKFLSLNKYLACAQRTTAQALKR